MWVFCMKPLNESVPNVSFCSEHSVIRHVTKPTTSAWTLSCQPTYVSRRGSGYVKWSKP
ncbi:hypothetical protein CsSME_00007661 [Camellia sinensis var. sinensis]